MDIISIKNVGSSVNKIVTVRGWVYNSRRSGKIGFLSIRDDLG